MNAGQWQDPVLLMLLAPTLMAVMSALATVGTLEMAYNAQVLLHIESWEAVSSS